MIYIFDDRNQRRKDNEEKLRAFSDLITFKTVTLIPGKPAEECIFDSIDNPDCVIFHKSYTFGDEDVTFETIQQLFTSLNVPIVVFSGGIEGSNKGNSEVNMNADLMYQNLPYFLENFRQNGSINIDTLLWGKRYMLNELLQFQNTMSEKYFIDKDPDELLENPAVVKRFIKNACRKINENLGDAVISDIESNDQITWLDLATIIDSNIRKYQ